MKISKTAVLTAWSALMIAWLWLMFVSAADKNLYVDPNNAIQHFEKVRIVPTESGDNSMADIVKKWNLFWIETDYNFALSRSWTDANQISGNTMWSSILGWIVNKILWGIYNGILWWKTNKITTGNNNGILWWENNEIGGNYSVIFWWMGNEIWSWSYSAIVGGSGNKTNGSYLVVVWRNNNARWYNSVAMWSGKLNATSSFLWTDGIYSGNFTTNHVFAVLWDKGMVINATGAHDLAQLTISGSLVVYDDKNAPVCNNDTKWVLKVVDWNASNTNQKCFCSCDGSWRNSLYESSKCPEICSNETTRTGDRCGGVVRDCGNNPYVYTWNAVSWACVYGELVNGTWAFLVSTEKSWGVLTNYINRSCQSSNGEVRICRDELKWEGCPNHYTGECLWREGTDTGHIVLSENKSPESTAEYWEYSITGVNNRELCKYKCDDESERNPVEKRCVPFECEWVLETGAEANNDLLPKSHGVKYTYAPTSWAACTYHCTGDYHYNPETEKCELCPEWLVFINGGCRPVCDVDSTVKQDLEVFFISLTWSISHYTMMDRNLWASEAFNQNISSPNKKSYGCYFQWWNNYPFNAGRSGSSYTTWTLTDIENYGPGRLKGYYYNSKRHCYDGKNPMYPIKNASASIPKNIRFWWWWQSDIYGNFTQIGWTDIDRQWPCPTGYHIPWGVEMENIMNDWKAISNYNESDTEAINLEKSKKMASDLLLPFAWWNGESCSKNENLWVGTLWKYFISDYYRFNNHHLHLWLTTDPDGIFLKGNGLSYGISIRCVKNDISANQKITINANGWTKAVIVIDWETSNQGTIVTLWEPERTWYTFGWWYKDTKFTTKVDKWGKISNGGQLYAKWIAKECDVASTKVQDLELFLIWGSWDISHYMMMDRNLWATEIYNQKGKNLQNLWSYGCYFQWWNNYGFSTWAATTTGQINPASFWPSQYSNDKFYCYTSGYNDPSLYTSINWHIWWWWWRKSNGWSNWSDGTDIDRKGPCPAWYHVPRGKEMDDLLDDWENANSSSRENKWDAFASHILMPYGTYMEVWCGWQNRTRNWWWVWLSDGYNKNGGQYIEVEIHDDGPTFRGISQTHGMQVRCVKNNLRDIPSKVSVHPDGWTWAVISIDWETSNQGKIVALWEPTKAWYTFEWWYKDASFKNGVYKWDTISANGHLYAKWTADNPGNGDDTVAKDLDVYFLKSDWSVAHDTLMDRNLWATEIYNQNYASPNKASYGNYFQWWNNYGFPSEWDVTTSPFQVDASGYGPGRYYNNWMFIAKSASFYDWSSVQNDNLWWWSGDDNSNNWWYDTGNNIAINVTWRQWPCPAWYHVPSIWETLAICNNWNNANTVTTNKEHQLASDLLLPFVGARNSSAALRRQGSSLDYWSSTPVPDMDGNEAFILNCNYGSVGARQYRAYGLSVRCFKNSDNSQVLTIHPNEWTNAVIAVDGNVITALWTPTKAWFTFWWWYKDASFKNRVYKWDTISANGHLYAKWVSNDCKITIKYNPNGWTLQRSSDTQKIDCGTKVTLPSATKTGSVFVAWWEENSGIRAWWAGDPYTWWWTNVTLFATWTGQSPQPEENIIIGCNIPVKWCDNTIPSVTGFDAINYKITAGSAPFPIYVYTKVNYIAWNSLDLSYEVKDGNSGRLRHIISGWKCNRQSTWDEWYKPAFAATNCAENGTSSDYAPEYASLSPGSQVTQKTVTYDGKKYKISLVCSMQSPRINSCNKNFTVTYDANGWVSVSKSTASVYYNKSVDLTPIATWQDWYKFIWWNTSSTATTALSSYTMPCDNLRLYAIYSNQCAKNFTVTYDKNGWVSVSKSTASVYYNKTVDLTPTATPNRWYTFTWWNTSSTATTALSSYTMPCENKTLYAIYSVNSVPPIIEPILPVCWIASGQSYDSHWPIDEELCSVWSGSKPRMKPGKWERTCTTAFGTWNCSADIITGSSTNPDPQPGNKKYCFWMKYQIPCSDWLSSWNGCQSLQWEHYVAVDYYPSCSSVNWKIIIKPVDWIWGEKEKFSAERLPGRINSDDICGTNAFVDGNGLNTSRRCYFKTNSNWWQSLSFDGEDTCSSYVLVDNLDPYSGWYKCEN